MWIATYGRGLMRVDASGVVTLTAPASLPHDNVLAVFEDAEENVWVGTHGGLLRLRRERGQHDHRRCDGAPLSINTIYEDPRRLAPRGGAERPAVPGGPADARAGGRCRPASRRLPIRNVFRDSQGRLWIGTDGQGVARVDGTADRPATR